MRIRDNRPADIFDAYLTLSLLSNARTRSVVLFAILSSSARGLVHASQFKRHVGRKTHVRVRKYENTKVNRSIWFHRDGISSNLFASEPPSSPSFTRAARATTGLISTLYTNHAISRRAARRDRSLRNSSQITISIVASTLR